MPRMMDSSISTAPKPCPGTDSNRRRQTSVDPRSFSADGASFCEQLTELYHRLRTRLTSTEGLNKGTPLPTPCAFDSPFVSEVPCKTKSTGRYGMKSLQRSLATVCARANNQHQLPRLPWRKGKGLGKGGKRGGKRSSGLWKNPVRERRRR